MWWTEEFEFKNVMHRTFFLDEQGGPPRLQYQNETKRSVAIHQLKEQFERNANSYKQQKPTKEKKETK